jgi:hypothetical protein
MANEFRVKNGLITPAVLSEETDGKIVLTRLDADTGDDKGVILSFETKETDIAADDVLGKITFSAPDEDTGTDALLVAGAIAVVSEGDFSSSSNASKMVFQTGASETATTKMTISSAGLVTLANNLNVGGATTLDGAVTLGNATGDDITVTGYLASDLIPKTDMAYDLGSAALGFNTVNIGAAGIIAFDNDVKLTHSTNKLTLTGGLGFFLADDGIIGSVTDASNIHLKSGGGVSLGSSTYDNASIGLQVNSIVAGDDYVEARLRINVSESAYPTSTEPADLGFVVLENSSSLFGAMGMVITHGADSGGTTWGIGTSQTASQRLVIGHMETKSWDAVKGTVESPFDTDTNNDKQNLMTFDTNGDITMELGSFKGSTAQAGGFSILNAGTDNTPNTKFQFTNGGELRFYEHDDSLNNYISLKAPDNLTGTGNYVLTLPVDDGSNGQVLSTNGSGALAWANASSGGIDVSGTNNRMVRMHNTDDIQDTGITVDDSNNMSGIGTISSGAITATGTSTFATAIEPDADDGATIGSANKNWSDVFLADAAVLNFGDDQDVTLTHVVDTGLLLSSTDQLQFGDSGTYIYQSADGVLDLVSDTEIELTGPTLDLNASTAVTIDTPSITITDSTTSSATEGGFIRLVSDDGAAMANDHRLGVIEFAGAEDASNTITVGARIEAVCDAGWSASENGAALVMYTTDANAAQSEVLRLDSDKLATFAGSVTILGDFNITGDINSTSVTDLDVTDKTITIANGAGDSAAADGAGIVVGGASASLLYDHTGTQWEFNKNVEFTGHILPGTDDTYDIGSAGAAWQDLFLEGDITLTDAGTLSTSAGALTITAAAASTWSTSAGALTLTSAAACTWSTTAGILTIDGDDGVQISSTAAGNIDLDSFADIVLDVVDDGHVIYQEAGVTHSARGHGTVEITNLAGTTGATAIDVFDCTVFQAVKYFILVEDTAADHYMTTEILVLGDDNGASAATAVMTTYAVLFNEAELGVFTVAGSGNNITLSYDATNQDGTDLHRVRVVANRIASLSDAGQ